MAKAAKVKARGMASGKPGGGSLLWLQGLGCGAVVAMATPTALLAALLLAPTLVAWLFDGSADRRAAKSVLLWGMAGSVRPMVALWTGGHTTGLALGLASDLAVLATAWAAQAASWLVSELLPLVIVAGFNAAAAARTFRLRQMRTANETEWDIPPHPGDI